MTISSFPYFVDSNTELLILGTMPGSVSLAKQEYYGNPRNHFWKIICTICDALPIPENFDEKVKILQSNKIGLWDVLENCERKGSLDIHIKNQKENDFFALFEKFPKINKIVFNGKQSHAFFYKSFGQIKGITYYVMPSTSPANTMTFENKLKIWSSCFK
ncbi:G/U mismatch-specific uracil-DNA glycosylase [Flavobacterium sp. 103]|uniref:DNA-deoxyinosine glycosylase n=1 Tax=unclassified Flavobacterium TaxID=196869 RepID=UPI000D5ECB1A|nr:MULTISPECIES: DNA-deoxyinosine glycosylase [unclassified Flavobacterium]PVX47790.1 G/U mismatch-specific uracil-DNA glycosylase [Flavobacterium sp. 103]QKJ63707.1 DNA-deoxyinosine glycosylase [Flavobacterium sp. M31R6]